MERLYRDLTELRENYGAIGVKIELESEYFDKTELKKIRIMADQNKLLFAIKLGGFSSFNDLCTAYEINSDIIIAPMIESRYAFEKFIKTYEKIYKNKEYSPKLFISIETKVAVQNVLDILSSDYIRKIDGLILGRGDLANSLGLHNVEDNKILQIAQSIKEQTVKYNKKMTVGGKITETSIEFLRKIQPEYTETRRIIFQGVPTKDGIEHAIAFEQNLIMNKEYKTQDDLMRIKRLEERIKI